MLDKHRQCLLEYFFSARDMENISYYSDQNIFFFWKSLPSAKNLDWLFSKNLFANGTFSWVWKLPTYAKNIGKKTQKSLAMTSEIAIKNPAHFFLH